MSVLFVKNHDDKALVEGFWYDFKRTIDENPFIAAENTKKGWITKSHNSLKFSGPIVGEGNVKMHEKLVRIFDSGQMIHFDCTVHIITVQLGSCIFDPVDYLVVRSALEHIVLLLNLLENL